MNIKGREILLLWIIYTVQLNLFAQDTITIKFDTEYHLSNDPGYGFMMLSNNQSDLVNYEGETYQVTFPNHFFVTDTAIAFNYFTGWENPAIKNNTAFLIGNYTSHSPIMYVDYNHNLDFSDDGLPLKFKSDSTAIVYLNNSKLDNASFPIKFFYPKLNSKKKKNVKSIFTSMGPYTKGNNIVSVDYWLAHKRMNYKIIDSWLGRKSIKIGIYDYDCNGLYNDEGQDRILIGNYEENFISGKLDKGAVTFSKNVLISIADITYEVIEIEATGKYMRLRKSNSEYLEPLTIGDYVGNLNIKLLSGETKSIEELKSKNKYVLLDFWGGWCKGCTEQLPSLKNLNSKYTDKIQVIGLNYGDTLSTINEYLSENKIEWNNGFANEQIMKKLSIDGFPNYLLLDSECKILIMNGDINDIEKRL